MFGNARKQRSFEIHLSAGVKEKVKQSKNGGRCGISRSGRPMARNDKGVK